MTEPIVRWLNSRRKDGWDSTIDTSNYNSNNSKRHNNRVNYIFFMSKVRTLTSRIATSKPYCGETRVATIAVMLIIDYFSILAPIRFD